MAIEPPTPNKPDVDPKEPSQRLVGLPNSGKFLRVVLLIIVLAAAALLSAGWFRSIENPDVHEEQYYKCPLTGYDRTVIIHNGKTVSNRISANEVSDWSDANGLPGLAPGQIGWELASTFTTEGTSPPRIGEGFCQMVPYRLFHEQIPTTEMTREEALRSYQQYVIKTAPDRRFFHQAIDEWLNQAE